MSNKDKRVLLSFDVEEFDLPLEFGGQISESEQLEIGRQGLEEALHLLDRIGVQATLFTTARLAEHASNTLRDCAGKHEIASHGMRHDRFEPEDFRSCVKRLSRLQSRKSSASEWLAYNLSMPKPPLPPGTRTTPQKIPFASQAVMTIATYREHPD